MNILKQPQEEVTLKLQQAILKFGKKAVGKAYGSDTRIAQIIKDLEDESKPNKPGFGVITKLTQAINQLEEV